MHKPWVSILTSGTGSAVYSVTWLVIISAVGEFCYTIKKKKRKLVGGKNPERNSIVWTDAQTLG